MQRQNDDDDEIQKLQDYILNIWKPAAAAFRRRQKTVAGGAAAAEPAIIATADTTTTTAPYPVNNNNESKKPVVLIKKRGPKGLVNLRRGQKGQTQGKFDFLRIDLFDTISIVA